MKKILIAETNALIKDILATAFTDLQGFEGEVIFADTPDEALNLIKIQSPDIFLISDGEEFDDIETIYNNARKTASNIPFVILYTLGKSVDYIDTENPEVINIVLKKPFSVIKLLGIIKGLSEGRINEIELIEEPFDKEAFIKEAIKSGRLKVPEILRDREEFVGLIPTESNENKEEEKRVEKLEIGKQTKNEVEETPKKEEKPNLFLNFERNFTNKKEPEKPAQETESSQSGNVFLSAMKSLDDWDE
ncbi:hypothetical protein IJJ97_02640 [bacterium]|nr:hypothetical protein [bacterium]